MLWRSELFVTCHLRLHRPRQWSWDLHNLNIDAHVNAIFHANVCHVRAVVHNHATWSVMHVIPAYQQGNLMQLWAGTNPGTMPSS